MKIIPTDTYLNGIYSSNNLYLDVFDFWLTLLRGVYYPAGQSLRLTSSFKGVIN